MLKILCANCLCLSPAISSQFTVEMYAAAKNCEKFTKTALSEIQDRSRLWMLANLKSPSAVQQVCRPTYLQPFLHYKSQ